MRTLLVVASAVLIACALARGLGPYLCLSCGQ